MTPEEEIMVDELSLDQDCLESVFSYLSIIEKVKCERVCKSWKTVLNKMFNGQKAIGNQPTIFSLQDHCQVSYHWVTSLDVIPKVTLTNLSILPKILQKFPELRSIAITRSKEPTFCEDANAKRLASQPSNPEENCLPRERDADVQRFLDPFIDLEMMEQEMPRIQPEMMEQDVPEPQMVRVRHPVDLDMVNRFMGEHPHRRQLLRRYAVVMAGRRVRARVAPPAPRPTNEEDFLDVVAKYALKLECIDVTGLKLYRGSRAEGETAG